MAAYHWEHALRLERIPHIRRGSRSQEGRWNGGGWVALDAGVLSDVAAAEAAVVVDTESAVVVVAGGELPLLLRPQSSRGSGRW